MNIWFTSDSHFDHENILTFESQGKLMRPEFKNVEEMNECMTDLWNETVQDGDHVWHLGDFGFGSEEITRKRWNRLKGRKKFILGNHDDAALMLDIVGKRNFFFWKRFKEYENPFIASHVPLHRFTLLAGDPFENRQLKNVFGHIHGHNAPEGGYLNVCVEKTGYRPIHIDEVQEKLKGLNW